MLGFHHRLHTRHLRITTQTTIQLKQAACVASAFGTARDLSRRQGSGTHLFLHLLKLGWLWRWRGRRRRLRHGSADISWRGLPVAVLRRPPIVAALVRRLVWRLNVLPGQALCLAALVGCSGGRVAVRLGTALVPRGAVHGGRQRKTALGYLNTRHTCRTRHARTQQVRHALRRLQRRLPAQNETPDKRLPPGSEATTLCVLAHIQCLLRCFWQQTRSRWRQGAA